MNVSKELGCYIMDTMPFQWQAWRSMESSTKPLNPVPGAELNHCANGFHFSCCRNEKSWNEPKSHFMYNIKLIGFNFAPFCFLFVFERFLCTFIRTSMHNYIRLTLRSIYQSPLTAVCLYRRLAFRFKCVLRSSIS